MEQDVLAKIKNPLSKAGALARGFWPSKSKKSEETGAEVPVIEPEAVAAPEALEATAPVEAAPPPPPAGGGQEAKTDGGVSALADLFVETGGEIDKNLEAILEIVPEVSIDELMDELDEIRNMLRGRLAE